MIAEAFDTAVTLGLALLAWIALLSAVVVAALYAVVALVAGACRAVWRGVAGALAASRALRGLDARPDRYRPPQRPSWAAAPSGVGEAA